MSIARAVIGASFGDEGKGVTTDFLASHGGNVVVRYNGGANAGHTVVTPEGKRHVFSHYGSGSFLGMPTYLSEFFICNPILFLEEYHKLKSICDVPQVFVHPMCKVTTFADMMINQKLEAKRGKGKHGSCGVGINETINRSEVIDLVMADLWNRSSKVETCVREICGKYAQFRLQEELLPKNEIDNLVGLFLEQCWEFAELVAPAGIQECTDPIFEGAQGLLLDQDNKEFFPHLTRSNTGIKNVKILCDQAGIDTIEPYYVSRTYLTRHGAGVLPGEDGNLKFEDKTNLPNPHQDTLRFAKLDYKAMLKRCHEDSPNFRLVLTHCDQYYEDGMKANLYCSGETREYMQEYI